MSYLGRCLNVMYISQDLELWSPLEVLGTLGTFENLSNSFPILIPKALVSAAQFSGAQSVRSFRMSASAAQILTGER